MDCQGIWELVEPQLDEMFYTGLENGSGKLQIQLGPPPFYERYP